MLPSPLARQPCDYIKRATRAPVSRKKFALKRKLSAQCAAVWMEVGFHGENARVPAVSSAIGRRSAPITAASAPRALPLCVSLARLPCADEEFIIPAREMNLGTKRREKVDIPRVERALVRRDADKIIISKQSAGGRVYRYLFITDLDFINDENGSRGLREFFPP